MSREFRARTGSANMSINAHCDVSWRVEIDGFVSFVVDNERSVIAAMTIYGGSFVKELAVLFQKADTENKGRLVLAFWHYFQKYNDMAKEIAVRTDSHT